MSKPFIDHEITIDQALNMAEITKIALYGAQSCWWTLSWMDIYKHPTGLPCDPRGGMLMQTLDGSAEQALDFIREAQKNPTHYGKHGLRAFLLAYHGCIKVKSARSGNIVPTCFESWDQYNELIDSYEYERTREEGE